MLCGYIRTFVTMNEGPNVLIFVPALLFLVRSHPEEEKVR